MKVYIVFSEGRWGSNVHQIFRHKIDAETFIAQSEEDDLYIKEHEVIE
jgi:hypothetical protein